MSNRRPRSSVLVLAIAAVAGGTFASFNACSLDSTGLNSLGADAAVDGAPSPRDATLDVAETGPAPDANDAARGDGPCASTETDCLDGVDNDCNGLTDCADPACTVGYSCVPTPPAGGFTGFAIYEPTRSSPCPPPYSTPSDTFEELTFLPASCASCSCQAQGASCGSATLTCNAGGACGSDGGMSAVVGEGCSELDGGITLGPSSACSLGVPAATPGSCIASGGAATVNPVTFGYLSRVCTATEGPGGGCDAGSACVAKPASGFHGPCVFQATDTAVSCPPGYASANVTMSDAGSFTDTRGCTSCSCAGPTGAACRGSATLQGAAGCASDAGSALVTVPADETCHPAASAVTEAIGSAALDAGVVSQGSCAPSGGQASGAVKPKDQTVYCCRK